MPSLEAPDEVLAQLRAMIAPTRMPSGGRLPSERRIAEQLSATRFAVRAGLQQLEKEGLIRSASKRIRVVSEQTRSTQGMLSSTIGLISLLQPQQLMLNPTTATSTQWFYLGATEALQGANLNLLTLHPNNISPDQLKRFAAECLLGCAMLADVLNEDSGVQILNTLVDLGVPTAAYADVLLPEQLARARFDVVLSDHRKGAYELTKFLIARGCRNIQRFDEGDPVSMKHHWRVQRALGFEEACREAGLPVKPVIWIPQLYGYDGSAESFQNWARVNAGFLYAPMIKGGCDALMAISDGQTHGLAAGCRHLGKDPARDIAIVGYDNYWRASQHMVHEPTPPLATVDKHHKKIGLALIDVLLWRAKNRPTEPKVHMIEPELIVIPR